MDAASLMSPPPIPPVPLPARATKRYGSAVSAPARFQGEKCSRDSSAMAACSPSGISRFFMSQTETTTSRKRNSTACSSIPGGIGVSWQAAGLTGIVEHLLDAVYQRGQHRVLEQGIQAGQQECAEHHCDQDLDRRVNIALAGTLRQLFFCLHGLYRQNTAHSVKLISDLLHWWSLHFCFYGFNIVVLLLLHPCHLLASLGCPAFGRLLRGRRCLRHGERLLVGIQHGIVELIAEFRGHREAHFLVAVHRLPAGHGYEQAVPAALHHLDPPHGKTAVYGRRGISPDAALLSGRVHGTDLDIQCRHKNPPSFSAFLKALMLSIQQTGRRGEPSACQSCIVWPWACCGAANPISWKPTRST